MNFKSNLIIAFLMFFLIPLTSNAQFWKKKKPEAPKTPAASEPKKKDEKIKAYKDVITKDAITSQGMITTHKVKDKNYFELSNKILEKEILI